MPKEEVAAGLLELAKPESAASCPWYVHQAGIQSLGKLQVKSEAVISMLVRIGLDRFGQQELVEEAVRAIKTISKDAIPDVNRFQAEVPFTITSIYLINASIRFVSHCYKGLLGDK